jgi:NAD(P)-dependent dehydrogenase (short-subunit alcohol dehydrogenase family)
MKNKIVLITGGTGGIGKQTALVLAHLGAHVVVTGRSPAGGEAALSELKQLSRSPRVDLLLADLSTRDGVRALADQFKEKYDRLDVLVNNAGLAESRRRLTEDGIEANLAVNALAPFLLTHLLMDRLMAGRSPARGTARVVCLAGGEAKGRIALDNLQAEGSFEGRQAYSHSKLVMMALMFEFARRVQDTQVTINVCYPGQARTHLSQAVSRAALPGFHWLAAPFFKWMDRPDDGRSAARAALSPVYLASSTAVEGINARCFDARCNVINWPAAVRDKATRQELWGIAEQLTIK